MWWSKVLMTHTPNTEDSKLQKDTELEDILHDLMVVSAGVVKVPYGSAGQKKKAIQALTSWKDKEVKIARLNGELKGISRYAQWDETSFRDERPIMEVDPRKTLKRIAEIFEELHSPQLQSGGK